MNTETVVIWIVLGILLIGSWFAIRAMTKKNDATASVVPEGNKLKLDTEKARLDPKSLDVVRVLNEMQRVGRKKNDK
jgi:hypothetical protein